MKCGKKGKFEKNLCEKCRKTSKRDSLKKENNKTSEIKHKKVISRHKDYFEGILQLRNVPKVIFQNIKELILESGANVAKAIKVRGGYDIYIDDQKFVVQLGKLMQKKIGGMIKKSYTLHTKKKDKDLYRLSLLFKLPKFKKGDKIEYKGDEVVVKKLSKEVTLQKIETGKIIKLKWKDVERLGLI